MAVLWDKSPSNPNAGKAKKPRLPRVTKMVTPDGSSDVEGPQVEPGSDEWAIEAWMGLSWTLSTIESSTCTFHDRRCRECLPDNTRVWVLGYVRVKYIIYRSANRTFLPACTSERVVRPVQHIRADVVVVDLARSQDRVIAARVVARMEVRR